VHLQGLSDADLPPLERAFFMACMLRDQLGQEEVAGEASRTLAQAAGPSSREKELTKLDRAQLLRLAATYAGKVLGLGPANNRLLQQRLINSGGSSAEFQQKLRNLSERHGPLALALVHQLYDLGWMLSERAVPGVAKGKKPAPSKHRAAFIGALIRMEPGSMDRLIAAAHYPDPSAMARLCTGIKADIAADPTFGDRALHACLAHALSRLQGQPPSSTAYAGAPPADQALRWLRSKAPSATSE
jgi:hypothetical protein